MERIKSMGNVQEVINAIEQHGVETIKKQLRLTDEEIKILMLLSQNKDLLHDMSLTA